MNGFLSFSVLLVHQSSLIGVRKKRGRKAEKKTGKKNSCSTATALASSTFSFDFFLHSFLSFLFLFPLCVLILVTFFRSFLFVCLL